MAEAIISPVGHFLNTQGVEKKEKDLKKACKEFEAVFTYELLKGMRRTVEKCDLFHGGMGEEIYESLFDMEISELWSGLGPNSMANLLYSRLSPLVQSDGAGEVQDPQPSPSVPESNVGVKDANESERPASQRGLSRAPRDLLLKR